MNSEEVRMAILRLAYERLKKRETPPLTPAQYSRELGISEAEIELNLHYLIGKQLLGGTVDTMTGGMVIFNLGSILPIGIDLVEGAHLPLHQQTAGMTFNVQGSMIGNQVAQGRDINQTQTTTIQTFEEACNYVDGRLAGDRAQEIKSLLKELDAELGRSAISPSTLRKLSEQVAKYGPVAAPVMDFVLRALGLRS